MPVFVEDPAQLSKQRLKSELVANNVALPTGESKKRVYLELYMKHVSAKRAADFSSDEEDQVQENGAEDPTVQEEEEEKEEQQEESDEMFVTQLTDDELKAQLLQFGVKAGPIVASTRALYEKKLQRLLDPAPQPKQNGTVDADQYSDSDDEEEDELGCDQDHPEPVVVAGTGSSRSQRVRCEPTLATHRTSSGEFDFVAEGFRETVPPSGSAQSSSSSASLPMGARVMYRPMESSRAAPPPPSPTPSITPTYVPSSFSITQMVEEGSVPMTDVLTEMFPDANRTPTGISATRRRPIKGAAGRPVQFKYPDTPTSPGTEERRELQRRLVPVWMQILVFLGVAALLYLIWTAAEDSLGNPFAALLDNLSQEAELVEERLPLSEPQEAPAPLLAGEE